MINLPNCNEKMIQVTDVTGRIFTGIAETEPADYCFHEYGRDEEAIKVCNYIIYSSDIREIRLLPELEIMTARKRSIS